MGTRSADDFMRRITDMVSALVCDYEMVSGSEVLFPSNKLAVGKCPRCVTPVTMSKHGYFCESNSCRFGLWKDNRYLSAKHIVLTNKMVNDLLYAGRTLVSGMYSKKTGRTYSAYLVLGDDGERSTYSIVFDRDEKK